MKRTICCIIMCTLLLCGCGAQEPETVQTTIFAMDTVMSLKACGQGAENALNEAAVLLGELEGQLSATDENSLLNSGGHHELMDMALELSERTGGAFDPTIHALVELWGFPTQEYYVPTADEIAAARAIDEWDLGGIAKGYAAAECVEVLARHDVEWAMLDLGGNVQTYGVKPDGTPWRVGIQDPEGGNYLGVLSVEGTMAVVTSGDYQRYFEENGVKYHHIIDPATGAPADSGLRSVTVICEDGTTADALSTALFVMGLEEGAEFWRASDDFEAVFVTAEGKIYATGGAALSDCEFEVISR